MKILLAISLCLFAWVIQSSPVRADAQSDWVDKYYHRLGAPDGTTALFAWAEFKKEVPPADRDGVFAAILDRAAQDPDGQGTIVDVLGALGNGNRRQWSAHLEQAVLAQAHNSDSAVRGMMPSVLTAHDPAKYRELILSYLADSDERVRYAAVSAISRWPDAKTILRQYVQTHQARRPGHPADPVEEAKQMLSELNEHG